MQVTRGSRPRLTAFCALALVSMAMEPSRNPYHMATAWIDPSWFSVHMVIGRRSCRKASISSGVILIRSRCLTPWPICCGGCSLIGAFLGFLGSIGSPLRTAAVVRSVPGRPPASADYGDDPTADDRPLMNRPSITRPSITRPSMTRPPDGAIAAAAASGDRLVVCFVCTGNICRSPMADVVFRQLAADTAMADGTTLADRLAISSAGTGGWQQGEPMDPRARAALERRGYTDHGHRAQKFEARWFETTDLVVCLDRGHQQTLLSLGRGRAGDTRFDDLLV